MKKRIVCMILAVTMITAVLTGCSSPSDTSSQANSTKSSSSDSTKPVTLKMWYHISANQAKVLISLLNDYQTQHPNIKIETQSVPFQDMQKQLSIGAAAGQLPDLSLCDTVNNSSLAAMGAALDITDEVKAWGQIDQFYSGPKSSTMYNGKYYGLPYYSNCLGIMYNKDLFDKAGVPYPTNDWTWDDFISKIHKTKSASAYGLTMCLFKSEEGVFNELPFFWQAGADWNKLNSAEGIKGLQTIADLYKGGYMSKDLISMTQADMCASLFSTGKSAMMVAGSWLTVNVQKSNPKLNYGVVPFPKSNGANTPSPIGGGNIILLSKANRDASWDLMKWLASEENIQKYCENAGYLPPREDSANSTSTWRNDPKLSVYLQSLSYARARGPHPQWPQISSDIQFAVQDVISGSKTASQALQEAAEDISSIKQ